MSRHVKRREKRRAIQAAASQPFVIAAHVEDFEIQAAEGDTKLPSFSMTAYTGGAMKPMGFMTPVVVDLSTAKAPAKAIPILRNHDVTEIVGHGTVEISAQRIRVVEGVVSGVGEAAQEVVALGRNKFPWQASIGADPGKMEFYASGESVNVNGRRFDGPVYVARDTEIGEVSFVAIGADKKTSANLAAAAAKGAEMNEFEKWLLANGFEAAALSDKAKAKLQAQFEAEQEADEPPPKVKAKAKEERDFEEVIRGGKAEQERKRAITSMISDAVQDNPDNLDVLEAIGRQAIEGGWDTTKVELELLRASRSKGPMPMADQYGRPSREITSKVIEAAVCRSGGLQNIEKHFDAHTLEACDKHFGQGGMGLQDLILHFANRNGFGARTYRNNIAGALRCAFQEQPSAIRAAGPSTFSLSGILSNVANKALRESFMSVENVWSRISAIGSVSDFKQRSTYSLTGDLTYKLVGAGGELEHGTLGEETYTNQADTYGRLLGIDRRDLINDDLGAFMTAGRRLGRGAALKINDVFWTEFLNNSSFFTTARANLDEGADTALSLASLDLADILFRSLTDPDGNPMGLMPAILLVPAGLYNTALQLIGSPLLVGGASTNGPGSNVFAGRYRVESSQYMHNTTYTGASAIKWYLLANPSDMPVIETVFLNGNQSPTIETAEMAENRLGITLRGYHDFGCNLQEYRGGVAMKGAS